MKYWTVLLCFLAYLNASAQNRVIGGEVRDGESRENLVGATVMISGTGRGTTTDADGMFSIVIPAPGAYPVEIRMIGYTDFDTVIVVGDTSVTGLVIPLSHSHTELPEVVVTGTRTMRAIEDVPVRVEVVPAEEIEEKLLMSPSSVAMLLNESTGMRVQTTSATSNTANLRIHGLNGRYTQLLTDGIPSFGGLSAGFSITQLPPLNLRQVEVIKGATSVLYGSDAISGVVNFLTRDPWDGPSVSALVNATTERGVDAAAFHGGRVGERFGYTVFGTKNVQPRRDIDGDGYADIAEYDRFSLTPKVVFESAGHLRGYVTAGYMEEYRLGGHISASPGAVGPDSPYLEEIRTRRRDAGSRLTVPAGTRGSLQMNLAGMRMDRRATYGQTPFEAVQEVLYADIQYEHALSAAHSLLVGGSYSLEHFNDRTPGQVSARSYRYRSPALFFQEEWKVSPRWTILGSGRADFHSTFGDLFTPRISVRFHPSDATTLRLSGGTGFKAPTIFVEEAEETGFRDVKPIEGAGAERSRGGSFDVSWEMITGKGLSVEFNAAMFLSRLRSALIADPDSLVSGTVVLRNIDGDLDTRGTEVSIRTSYGLFKLSLGYTYIYATQQDRGVREEIALTPRHSASMVLFYENHDAGIKSGLELYWTGRQRLERNPYRSVSPEYYILGFITEKAVGMFRLFINFENILDTRQTRWDPLVTGNPLRPDVRTVPVYAPTEGRVINGGIRLVLE